MFTIAASGFDFTTSSFITVKFYIVQCRVFFVGIKMSILELLKEIYVM